MFNSEMDVPFSFKGMDMFTYTYMNVVQHNCFRCTGPYKATKNIAHYLLAAISRSSLANNKSVLSSTAIQHFQNMSIFHFSISEQYLRNNSSNLYLMLTYE